MNSFTNYVYVLFVLIAFSVTIVYVSCHGNQNKAKKPSSSVPDHSTTVKNNLIFAKEDSLYVAIDDRLITVPKNSIIDYDSVYTGIYRVNNNSIHQIFSAQINNVAFFTTQANVGMGYRGFLYAFDLKRKKLLISDSTEHNYIFSSGGIFFLNKEYIFSVSKPNHENAEQPFTTYVEIYKIDDNKFHYVTNIKLNGDMIEDDTSIIKLYNTVITY